MPRLRTIKPSFFTHEELGELPPLARLLYAGLWCHADSAGRLEDRPRYLKTVILPYDDCDVAALLDLLIRKTFVVRYSIRGKSFLAIPKFLDHQNPHKKEAASKIPAPPKRAPQVNESEEESCTVQAPGESGADTVQALGGPGASTGQAPGEPDANPGQAGLSLVFGSLSLGSGDQPQKAADPPPPPPPPEPEPEVELEPEPPTHDDESEPAKKRRVVKKGQAQRKLSVQQEFHAWASKERFKAVRFPDTAMNVGQINKLFEFVKHCDPDELADAVVLFLQDPKKQALNPPCPLHTFAADYPKYLSLIRREAAQAGAH